jgi:hypothetical protein
MECDDHVAAAKITQLHAMYAPARHSFEIEIGRFIVNLQHAASRAFPQIKMQNQSDDQHT